MSGESLFGELVIRLASHPENIATEALHFILTKHSSAWPALRSFLNKVVPGLPDRLDFVTQAAQEDSGIPDLVGSDNQGREVLIIESKFWAGLTENQPTEYLARLPIDRDAGVVFLAPFQRLGSLWSELMNRCRQARLKVVEDKTTGPGIRRALTGRRVLTLIPWPALLDYMIREADSQRATACAAELDQLRGLCARMESEGFLPLRTEELAPEIGRRVRQLAELVDRIVVEELVANRGASTKNPKTGGSLQTGGGVGTYGRYFVMQGAGCFLSFYPRLWGLHGYPLWLCLGSLSKPDWTATPKLVESLRQYAVRQGLPFEDTYHGPGIPLVLAKGVELSAVVRNAAHQVERALDECRERTDHRKR